MRVAPTSNPYAVLGIPRDASDRQVQRAYRRLAKQYHPDLHPDAQTSPQMRRINEAWEILSNPGSRARYDAESERPMSTSFDHWSAPGRRSPSAGSLPQAWNTAWTSPSRAGTAAARYEHDGAGGRGLARTVAVALVLLVALFSGILPAPLLGIAVLVAARSILARFD